MKYWLRAGIITIIAYTIFSVGSFIVMKFFPNLVDSSATIENIIFFPQILGIYLAVFKSGFNFIEAKMGFTQYFEIFITGIIFYFIIGSIIGLIIGRIKHKNN